MKITLEKATNLILSGETVAIPTETVYGLAADTFNLNAVKKIFKLKGRPADNPLIVHIHDLEQLKHLAVGCPAEVQKLAEQFWPGPLSMVLKKRPTVPDIVTSGLDTVAVRMPDHSLTLSLIKKTGPLTAPSANISGRPSPTHPDHIEEDFGRDFPILDGGPSELGLESTVLDLSTQEITILRPGFIDVDMIKNVINREVRMLLSSDKKSQKKSPGTRFTHYKPKASVRWLNGPLHDVSGSDHYYLMHSSNYKGRKLKNIHCYNEDYNSFARDLYDHFRTADHLSCSIIFVETFADDQKHPLITALKDRIEKAVDA